MKSRLIKSLDLTEDGEKQFKNDVGLTLAISPEARKAIVSQLVSLASKRTGPEQRPIVEKLETETGLSIPELNRVLAVASLFVSAIQSADFKKDTPEDWADDLGSLNALENDKRSQFLDLIAQLRQNVSSDLESLKRETLASVGVMPFFRGASSTVELRAVLSKIINGAQKSQRSIQNSWMSSQ